MRHVGEVRRRERRSWCLNVLDPLTGVLGPLVGGGVVIYRGFILKVLGHAGGVSNLI